MTADSRTKQAETLHPICKTPVWLRKVQTLRRRWVLTRDFAPTWPETSKGKRSQNSTVTAPCLTRCLWPRCCPRDRNCFCCPSVKSAVRLSVSHLFSFPKLCKIWRKKVRYKVKILLVYSPSHAKGGKKDVINSFRQRRLLCSTPVLRCRGEAGMSHSYNLHGHDTDFWHSVFSFSLTKSYNYPLKAWILFLFLPFSPFMFGTSPFFQCV